MDIFGIFTTTKSVDNTESVPTIEVPKSDLKKLSYDVNAEWIQHNKVTEAIVDQPSPKTQTTVDPVEQAMTHPYIREKIKKEGVTDYHIRAIYDAFYCKMNAHRTDAGFQYVAKKLGWMSSGRTPEEDIKYHVNALVEYQSIQLRIELINQTLADYQRCNDMD